MSDFVHVERVRFRDLDPMGHVNNAAFLTYIEQARFAFLAQTGTVTTLDELNMILAHVEIDFEAPVRFGQEVEIDVRASRFGAKSFELEYVLRVDGTVAATAKSVQVAYDYERQHAVALPSEWRERMTPIPA